MAGNNIFNNPDSKWTEGKGANSDIVISSRIRLARNLKGIPFPYLLDRVKEQEILDRVGSILKNEEVREKIGSFQLYSMQALQSRERGVLIEKHLISPQHGQGQGTKGVAIGADEAVSIMINEEDHLRIQCLLSGMQLKEAWRIADNIDNLLEKYLDFAYDKNKGYLTSCPTNVGTGMRASLMLHLPGMVLTKQGYQVFATMSQIGLTVRGMYGEGTEASGNLFQISNQVTLGLTEEDIISHLSSVSLQLIEQERNARKMLMDEAAEQLEDRIWRAYGILANARLLSVNEAMGLLSELRLGIDLGIIKGIEPHLFNTLIVMIQEAFLQGEGDRETKPRMRDWKRAQVIREKITTKIGGDQHV